MLSDRFGPRVVMLRRHAVHRRRSAGRSFASSMTEVYAAYGVGVGLGIALVYTPAIGCVQPWFTRRRGLAAGLASAGIGAGTVVVPLLAAAAIAALQWRGALRRWPLGVLVLGARARPAARRAPAARRRRRQRAGSLARGAAQPTLLVAVLRSCWPRRACSFRSRTSRRRRATSASAMRAPSAWSA